MKKNVVVIPYVKSKSFEEKYGDWKWMDIAVMTWEYWCKKNDCILYIYDKPKYSDLIKDKLIDIKKDGSFKLNQEYFDLVFNNIKRGHAKSKLRIVNSTNNLTKFLRLNSLAINLLYR